MTRKHPASTVDRSLAVKYFDKAARFKADAEKMSVLADEFSGNGVAVLCVHAAIAYGDAIEWRSSRRSAFPGVRHPDPNRGRQGGPAGISDNSESQRCGIPSG
jgi:hypothetical protein